VTTARHKHAVERPSRPPRRRLLRVGLPAVAATLVTGSVVGVALAVDHPGAGEQAAAISQARKPLQATVDPADSPYLADRSGDFSRSARRVTVAALPKVTDRLWMTTDLNLWPSPRATGKPLDVLPKLHAVAVTGVEKKGFAQIVRYGEVRWVKAAYLAESKPKPPKPPKPAKEKTAAAKPAAPAAPSASAAPAGVSFAPCADGSATESGLTPSAVNLYRAVCNAFPALQHYGGYDAHGEHSSGKAIDFMIDGNSGLGQQVADWARAHAGELNLYDVIWAQHIWTPERSSEGWRSMPDRGSPTANHYDHVHISVN